MFKVTQEDGVPDEVGSKHDVAGAHLRHAVRQSLRLEGRSPHLEKAMEQEQSRRVHFHLGLRQKL